MGSSPWKHQVPFKGRSPTTFSASSYRGIEELKTTPYGCNFLTFINEVQQIHDSDTASVFSPDSQQDPPGYLILATTHSSSDFMTQISYLHQKLSKQGCHLVGRQGIFHLMGLVKFAAYKWLNMIKYRENEPGRIQLLTWALPTTYNKSKAKNELSL